MSVISDIRNDFFSYQLLASLYQKHADNLFETIPVELRFWFSANMASALGAVLDKLSDGLNAIKFIHIDSSIQLILQKNDFLSYYGYPRAVDHHSTTIQYMKLKPTDGKFFSQYVTDELLNRTELPQISAALKEKMTEAIYEIFVNAQIHSETEHIYTCGQFFPVKNKIEFTITDVGIGFKEKIRQRFGKDLSAVQAIQWAVQDRHTTKQGVTGGIGLAILREFIVKNRGKMQIVSADGFYEYSHLGEKANTMSARFPGTIVNLQFCTDDQAS
ncbi:MAG TPA: ATP-binding protein [Cytophagales bacterium]|nr:ATP-binding protein [Cytophagales bacterium]